MSSLDDEGRSFRSCEVYLMQCHVGKEWWSLSYGHNSRRNRFCVLFCISFAFKANNYGVFPDVLARASLHLKKYGSHCQYLVAESTEEVVALVSCSLQGNLAVSC